jgi:hypothetical protein
MDKIAAERGITDADKVMGLYDSGELTDGFVTKKGTFYDRAGAADYATKIKQLKQPLVYDKSLESTEFAGKRAFLTPEAPPEKGSYESLLGDMQNAGLVRGMTQKFDYAQVMRQMDQGLTTEQFRNMPYTDQKVVYDIADYIEKNQRERGLASEFKEFSPRHQGVPATGVAPKEFTSLGKRAAGIYNDELSKELDTVPKSEWTSPETVAKVVENMPIERFQKAGGTEAVKRVLARLGTEDLDTIYSSIPASEWPIIQNAIRNWHQKNHPGDFVPFDKAMEQVQNRLAGRYGPEVAQKAVDRGNELAKKKGGFLSETALEPIRNGEKDGETFNADGSVFVPPTDAKLDVVPLTSINLPADQFTAAGVAKALEPFKETLKNENIKAGVFRLATPDAEGKQQYSVDISALVDQEHRDNSAAFAKANGQEAVFDLAEQQSVATGGNGEAVLKSPAEVAKAAEALARGENPLTPGEEDVRPIDDRWHVVWKPRAEGKTTLRQTVHAASAEEAQQKAGVPEGAHIVSTEPVYAPGMRRAGYLPGKRKSAIRQAVEDIGEDLGMTFGALKNLGAEGKARRETEAAAQKRVAKTDYSKYNVPASQKPKGDKPTGWVLPNGDYVPLDTDYHQTWLGENADQLNKQFGTSFSGTANIQDRQDAINKGFIRAREYNGNLTVEANQKFFKGKAKQAIETLLTDHAENLDRAQINLLNDDGQVVDQVAARLFDAEDPRGAAMDMLDRVKPESQARKGGPSGIQIARSRGGYLPSSEPRAVKDAAFQDPDTGEIYSGRYHMAAYKAAREAGLSDAQLEKLTDGFVTNDGEFLDRNAAYNRAVELEQVAPKDYAEQVQAYKAEDLPVFPQEKGLETTLFNDVRKDQRPRGGYLPENIPPQGTPGFNDYAESLVAKAKAFPEVLAPELRRDKNGNVRAAWDGEPLFAAQEWDLFNTPLAKKSGSVDAFTTDLSKKMEEEYHSIKDRPELKGAEQWYELCRTKLREVLKTPEDIKLFGELLGATSPQQKVAPNFSDAVAAFNQIKSGAYDGMVAKYREGKAKFAAGDLKEFADETGKKGKAADLNAFMYWWAEKHDLVPKKANGAKYGLNSRAVMKVLDGTWMESVEGPKTPSFTGNLIGLWFKGIVDKWAMRTMTRLSSEGQPWRIIHQAETGITNPEYFAGEKAFQEAADRIGIKPDALQAILWVNEQRLWEENGWARSGAQHGATYQGLLEHTTKTPEGKLDFTPPKPPKKVKSKVAKIVEPQ